MKPSRHSFQVRYVTAVLSPYLSRGGREHKLGVRIHHTRVGAAISVDIMIVDLTFVDLCGTCVADLLFS